MDHETNTNRFEEQMRKLIEVNVELRQTAKKILELQ
jgi:hypothetical protein